MPDRCKLVWNGGENVKQPVCGLEWTARLFSGNLERFEWQRASYTPSFSQLIGCAISPRTVGAPDKDNDALS